MPTSRDHPERIGQFRIIDVLGEGGMGRVYLAEQDDPSRQVALKVLRTAVLGPETLARFRRESELLADLEHPNIARLYQAGTAETPGGQVFWLAMERVRGVDIITDATARGLDIRSRVALLAGVCRAVHHAHTRGVVHRDLKPGNILVDESGRPHILDFGIAHVATTDGTLTRTGEVLGTIPYMSPEQLEGQAKSVDPRSDVYSLGIIAYQLLAGRLPYPGIESASLVQALTQVRKTGPQRLATVMTAARGDLDTIVMKAISPDADRRYGSAAEFALDLERFNASRPIEARPPTIGYLLGLLIRRHKAVTVSIALILAVLVVATTVSIHFAVQEAAARARTDERAAELVAVNDFMVRMLTSADPEQARGRTITVREVVDEARYLLEADRDMPVSVADTLRRTLGVTYMRLGEHDIALELLDAARKSAAARDENALAERLLVEYATALQEKGLYEEAEALLSPITGRVTPDPKDEEILRTYLVAKQTQAQVIALSGRHEEGLGLLEALYGRSRELLGPDEPQTTSIGHDFSTVLREVGRYDEARRLAEETWRARRDRLGPDHPQTLVSRNLLGAIHHSKGDNELALTIFEEVGEARGRVLGPEHINTLNTLQNISAVLVELGRQAEALPILERIIAGIGRHFGHEHTRALRIQNIHAYALEDLGRLGEAETVFRRIIAIQERAGIEAHPENLAHYNNLAMLLMNKGALTEARTEFERLIPRTQSVVGAQHPYTLIFESNYGECLNRTGDYAAAVVALESAHAGLTAIAGPHHPRTLTAAGRLIEAYRGSGRMEDADRLESSLPEVE